MGFRLIASLHPMHVFVLTWRLFNARLPTKEVIMTRRVPLTSSCHLCHKNEEFAHHFFSHCFYAKVLWTLLPALFGLSSVSAGFKDLYIYVFHLKLYSQLLAFWKLVFMLLCGIYGRLGINSNIHWRWFPCHGRFIWYACVGGSIRFGRVLSI